MNVKLTVVIPVYNAAGKLSDCIDSLRRLEARLDAVQVIFVDDKSTDGSLALLMERTANHSNWDTIALDANSGSPSTPRNVGIRAARGEFLIFLDADDSLDPEGVVQALRIADEDRLDVVRAPMVVVENSFEYTHNRVPGFADLRDKASKVAAIFRHQSTTPTMVLRTAALRRSGIRWRRDLKMGEDTVFLAELCAAPTRVGYSPEVIYRYDRRTTDVESSTQAYGDRELSNHLDVWAIAQEALGRLGVDYFETRGHIAVQAMAQSFLRGYRGNLSLRTFSRLSTFLRPHADQLSPNRYSRRIQGVIDAAVRGDLDEFLAEIKPRLVIAGYDLKFILPIIPELSSAFTIRVDEWEGHDRHSEIQSRELLEWADIIWCEWLLGNAVWYARNKRADQRLIVRMHRFEMLRNFGNAIDSSSVDAFVTVSLFTLENFVRTFGFDRSKCRVIPNYIDASTYRRGTDQERNFKVALVGSVPRLKGLHRAVELMSLLRGIDERYSLTLFGQDHRKMPWLLKIDEEREYFEHVDVLVESLGLAEAIHHGGWVDTRQTLADFGVVLSTSDAESFHVAPFEGLASGNVAVVRRWEGSQYVYPDECLADSVQDMAEQILALRDPQHFEERSERGRAFVERTYSPARFTSLVEQLIRDIR